MEQFSGYIIMCNMGEIRGDLLQPQHSTIPVAVVANESSFNSSENINKKVPNSSSPNGNKQKHLFIFWTIFILDLALSFMDKM